MKRKKPPVKAQQITGRIVVGLWIAAFVWAVALFFYVGVTERYFTDPAAGILIFLPWTMVTAAILLQAWRKYWKTSKLQFYIRVAIWGITWVVMLGKTFLQ